MEQARLLLNSPDAKAKAQGLEQLLMLVGTMPFDADDSSVAAIIKSLHEMIKGNNAKTTRMALKILCDLVHKHGAASRKYFDNICESVIERLGDSKPFVRQQAIALYMQLIEDMGDMEYVWNRLQQQSVLTKNGHVRHSALICYLQSIDRFGLKFVPVMPVIPYVLNLLDDQLPTVREECVRCLTAFYRHIGPDFAIYLTQNAGLRPAHLKNIQQIIERTNLIREDERIQIDWSRLPMKTVGVGIASKSSSDDSGTLEPAAEIVPMLITTESDLEAEMDQIVNRIKDSKSHWQDRVGSLRKLGGLALGPARRLPNFFPQLKRCLPGIIIQANELRSAVAKETCVVVAFLSRTLGSEFSAITDAILPEFLRLAVSSIQVVADAADQCIRTILKYSKVHSAIRKIIDFARGKNPALRATATEYLALLLSSTPVDTLERYSDAILEQIRYSLTDANENARVAARSCYWAMRAHWPQRAQQLCDSLDSGVQKTLLQSVPEKSLQRSTPKNRRRSKLFPASIDSAMKEKDNDVDKEQKDPNGRLPSERIPSSPDTTEVISARTALQRYLPLMGGAVRVVRPEPDEGRNPSSEFRAQIAERERRAQLPAERVCQKIGSVNDAMTMCGSKDWNERLLAFEYISSNISTLHGRDTSRVIDLFRSHINDRNPKVSIACLIALCAFLSDSDSRKIGPCVSLLQSLMFAQLDTKEQIRHLATDATKLLYQSCNVYDLVTELLQIVQSKMVKLQDLALQAVIRIDEFRKDELMQFFRSSQNMQLAICKLQPLLAIRRPTSYKALCDILQMMSSSAPDLLERHIMQLPSSDQALVDKMVSISPSCVKGTSSDPIRETDFTQVTAPTRSTEIIVHDLDDSTSRDIRESETWSQEIANDNDLKSPSNASYCPKLYELSDDSKTLATLTEELTKPYLTQKKVLQVLRDISIHVGVNAVPSNAMAMKALLEGILQVLRKFSSRHEIHVDAAHILHTFLVQHSIQQLIGPCYATVFDCLFALQQVYRISVFEAAADTFDFADCIGVIESKLSDPETFRADLVTTIEFISYSFLSTQRDPSVIRWALDRLIPLLPVILQHKDIDVRKSCVFCIIDLYSELDADYLSGLWPLLEPVQLKLLRVFIDKRGLPIPPIDV